MSCGISLCIECGRKTGLSWGDTNCICHCGGKLAFGNTTDECEEEAILRRNIVKEAGLIFHDGKYIVPENGILYMKNVK